MIRSFIIVLALGTTVSAVEPPQRSFREEIAHTNALRNQRRKALHGTAVRIEEREWQRALKLKELDIEMARAQNEGKKAQAKKPKAAPEPLRPRVPLNEVPF